MKLLSHQETNFLLNPDKFNRNYQYLLIHRIKNKMKDVNRDLSFIKKHERALLIDKKKKFYDEAQELEKSISELRKERRQRSSVYFTPNLKTVIRELDVKIIKCEPQMIQLEKYLTWDKFIQKHKTIDEKGKHFLDSRLKELQNAFQRRIDKIEALRKNLLEGYMLSSNKFENELDVSEYDEPLKKWDYSELD